LRSSSSTRARSSSLDFAARISEMKFCFLGGLVGVWFGCESRRARSSAAASGEACARSRETDGARQMTTHPQPANLVRGGVGGRHGVARASLAAPLVLCGARARAFAPSLSVVADEGEGRERARTEESFRSPKGSCSREGWGGGACVCERSRGVLIGFGKRDRWCGALGEEGPLSLSSSTSSSSSLSQTATLSPPQSKHIAHTHTSTHTSTTPTDPHWFCARPFKAKTFRSLRWRADCALSPPRDHRTRPQSPIDPPIQTARPGGHRPALAPY
jgi:hypothetical protein